jgi:phage-related protein
MISSKPIEFVANALDELRDFPLDARREAGYQLDKVQQGKEPDDWKPMSSIGAGVSEIRIRKDNGAYRIIYVAKFSDAVYVLHCFQKKTEKTAQHDVNLAKVRYRELLKELEK